MLRFFVPLVFSEINASNVFLSPKTKSFTSSLLSPALTLTNSFSIAALTAGTAGVTSQTVSRSSKGQITGGRGRYSCPDFYDFVLLDDYNKLDYMFSASRRDAANRLLVNTIRSRRGDKSKTIPHRLSQFSSSFIRMTLPALCFAAGKGLIFTM